MKAFFETPRDIPQEISEHPEFIQKVEKMIAPFLETIQAEIEKMQATFKEQIKEINPEIGDDELEGLAENFINKMSRTKLEQAVNVVNNLYLLTAENVDLHVAGTKDKMTGLLNKEGFREKANKEFEIYDRYQKANKQLGMILIDGDNFKTINDNFGYEEGDKIIKHLAETIRHCVRSTDFAGRFGGEEFTILLTHLDNDPTIAKELLTRIQTAIKEGVKDEKDNMLVEPIVKPDGTPFTISLGFGSSNNRPAEEVNYKTLFREANIALEESKIKGRNRFTLFNELEEAPEITEEKYIQRTLSNAQRTLEEFKDPENRKKVEQIIIKAAKREFHEIFAPQSIAEEAEK